ncbi:Desmoglein-1-gamma [Oryzias melastigma]|uniref:Desmoglein-1-gamma n=1 Tax=Oryzias melastigma TaxID=30732 RepID=A0A834FC31_ORYME|nr:Desmoglein-1-gamma [Oryzias melastigma]
MARLFQSVLVVLVLVQVVIVVRQTSGKNLVRKKREWTLPRKPLKENKDYTRELSIAKICFDFQQDQKVEYYLEGHGASQKPFNVFVVNHETGVVRVTKILDREEVDTYVIKVIAKYANGLDAARPVELRIKVEDENDNDPVFPVMSPVDVYELSPTGTFVTQVNATDADEPGNKNSELAYSLISQNPPHDMFSIDKGGMISVKNPNLDRETCAQYNLTVQVKDLNGEDGGRTGNRHRHHQCLGP